MHDNQDLVGPSLSLGHPSTPLSSLSAPVLCAQPLKVFDSSLVAGEISRRLFTSFSLPLRVSLDEGVDSAAIRCQSVGVVTRR